MENYRRTGTRIRTLGLSRTRQIPASNCPRSCSCLVGHVQPDRVKCESSSWGSPTEGSRMWSSPISIARLKRATRCPGSGLVPAFQRHTQRALTCKRRANPLHDSPDSTLNLSRRSGKSGGNRDGSTLYTLCCVRLMYLPLDLKLPRGLCQVQSGPVGNRRCWPRVGRELPVRRGRIPSPLLQQFEIAVETQGNSSDDFSSARRGAPYSTPRKASGPNRYRDHMPKQPNPAPYRQP